MKKNKSIAISPYVFPGIPVVGGAAPEIDREDVIRKVCEHYRTTRLLIFSKSQQQNIVLARQVVMYVLVSEGGQTISEVGRLFKRNHTTVRASVNKIRDYLQVYPALKRWLGDVIYGVRVESDKKEAI